MLSIEHYNNLIKYIGYAAMSLDYIIERESVSKDEESMRFVLDVQKNHEKLTDILNFLVVKPISENSHFDKCLNLMDEVEKIIIRRLEFISTPELDKILKRIESLAINVENKAIKLQLVA